MWAYQAALQTLILLRKITAGDVAKANRVLRILKKGGKDDVLNDAAHYAFSNDGQEISRAGSASLRE